MHLLVKNLFQFDEKLCSYYKSNKVGLSDRLCQVRCHPSWRFKSEPPPLLALCLGLQQISDSRSEKVNTSFKNKIS